MRAGAFAETRVIELLNRRFVPFYFNTSGPGLGKDQAAEQFVKGKLDNPFAYFAAFDPDSGRRLGVTEVYADKDDVFHFLADLLATHPQYAAMTADESATIASAEARPEDEAAQLTAGQLLEQLGRYQQARGTFARVIGGGAKAARATAYVAMARMRRYEKQWSELAELLTEMADANDGDELGIGGDVVMERAYASLAEKRYQETKDALEAGIKQYPRSRRSSEMHFYAGVCCFFLAEHDRAYYHWCWVVENLPDDRLVRRCYIAAAREGMPYPNPELGGYKSAHQGGNIQVIEGAYAKACERYRLVKTALREP